MMSKPSLTSADGIWPFFGSINLSVEVVVHDDVEWQELFTPDELQRFRKRLTAYGYFEIAKD